MSLTRNEKLTLYMLAAISFTNILDFVVLMPLGHTLQETFDMTPFEWSAVVSSYTLAAAVSGLLSIFIIDKFERKKMFLSIYFFFTIGTFLCGIATTYQFLLIARLFTGIFGGLINAALFTIVGDLLPENKRGTGIGILMTGFAVSSAVGVPIGLYLGVKIDWHAPFLIISALAAILWVVSYKRLPVLDGHLTHKNTKTSFATPLLMVLKNKKQLTGLFALSLVFFGHFIIIPFFTPYLVSNIGFEDQQLTWIYFLGGIATIYFSPKIGQWSDKFGKYKTFVIISFITILPVLVLTNVAPMSIPFVLVLSTIMFICGSRSIPANALLINTTTAAQRGSFMSIRSSVQNLSQGAASFASGLIITTNPIDQTLNHYNILGYISVTATMFGVVFFKYLKDKPVSNTQKESISVP
ncbi:MFS transporter [Flammeovirga sp. MY04]|uniref:MFS transporter n=1 Tax=Flammeovirga sp. MY04 TaxID=1191459 RepID=UPI0013052A60|nr:MFS transporter [Flammeovirga sp. MY04]ANQ47766.2 MFS transporter [Flammeovirga sp. MY04]